MAEDARDTHSDPVPPTSTADSTGTAGNAETPAGAPSLEEMIEEMLLGGPRRYNRVEVSERAGMQVDLAIRIWQALGFPSPPDDAIAFTDEDSVALRDIQELLGHEFVNEEMVLDLARAVGQTMGRLASWLGDVWLRQLAGHLLEPGEQGTGETVAAALLATRELRPKFDHLLLQGWRRHLTAVGLRAMSTTAAATADPTTGTARVAVGFADVVSFTRQSRRLDGQSLADFVEGFERGAAQIVTELGGRVVKTLGDEILFVADDPSAAAEIGLRIAEHGENDDDFPQVRVGLATGEVLLRLGDVFGTPVNLAARLTSIAYPGSVLVDPELARILIDDRAYELRALHSRPLQGLGKVRPWALRRPADRSDRSSDRNKDRHDDGERGKERSGEREQARADGRDRKRSRDRDRDRDRSRTPDERDG